MKRILVIVLIGTLTACANFGAGFKPPTNKYYWTSGKYKNSMEFVDYILFQDQEMRECGIDPFDGDTDLASKALCMEKKGWVNTAGPTCEQDIYKNQQACVEWLSEHGH